MSSMEVSTFFITSNILRIVLWYISGGGDIPNSNLWYLYLPSGVINVHNLELYSSHCSCQNPFEQSNLKNIFASAILVITFLRVGNLKCSRWIALLRFRAPKQILNFPSGLCTICIALTHSVSWVILFITPASSILSRSTFTSLNMVNRVFLDASITNTPFCFSFMLTRPGKQPIPVNNTL